MSQAASVATRLDALTLRDRQACRRLQKAIRRRERQGKAVSELQDKLERRVLAAERRVAQRRALQPRLDLPEELPIAEQREPILEALQANSVIVVCGATGSGKTTQLPKLCLAAGRGIAGTIAHTQPRRIAARAVATRLAEELELQLGTGVGFKVRFTDRSDPLSLVKVMTDGILLNEIRSDPTLAAYDTVIVDEAHERNLNVDMLLGYLKRLLLKRRDLKLIVTSATIDPERFAAYFDGAPIVRVAGRSFPVTTRYRPPEAGLELADAVARAATELAALDVEELGGGGFRDMLVFLPGERWIRAAAKALADAGPSGFDVLPLYGRLATSEQQRIFAPRERPRIVLATNIAETSLTVPRIRFVIDSGLARASRYAARHRVQRLGVEPVAKANAEQRAGRCGRLAPGVCVRLYSEADFEARSEFPDAEILRTDLAGVILRLAALGVDDLEEFPFLDAPPTKAVNDAFRLLQVLGAMDEQRQLTKEGESMAQLPLDPRLAKLLLTAERRGAVRDALVLAAGLSIVDPREFPPDRIEQAREQHAAFADSRSDFVTLLNLWRGYQRERRAGPKALRNWCQRHFLSLSRLREWDDVRAQLKEIVRSLGWRQTGSARDYRALHEIVLSAFVDFVAERHGEGGYRGMHDARAALFPGSSAAAKRPRWVVAAEHVATERAYLRTAAQINPRWVVAAAPHIVKREYSDPRWDVERGRVMAREIVSAFGLVLSGERQVDYAPIDPDEAHRIFVRDALAAWQLGEERAFLKHNRSVRETVLGWEARLRSRDLFVGDRAFERHYAEALPKHVCDRRSLRAWCRKRGRSKRLQIAVDELVTRPLSALAADRYPLRMSIAGQELKLSYRYEPGHPADGITLRVPAALLGALRPEPLEWLVPGWLEHKVAALLRTLPKDLRRTLVPIPDTVAALMPLLEQSFGQQALPAALAQALLSSGLGAVPAEGFDVTALDAHLFMRIEVLGMDGAIRAAGRDLLELQSRFSARDSAAEPATAVEDSNWTRAQVAQWDFGALPSVVEVERAGLDLKLYPGLVDAEGVVRLELHPPGPIAALEHRQGVRRLLLKQLPQQSSLVRDAVLADAELLLMFHGVGESVDLVDDVLLAAAEECFAIDAGIRDREAFEACLLAGRAEFVTVGERLIGQMRDLLGRLRRVRKRLAELETRLPQASRDDIETQLAELVTSKTLSSTPAAWRGELGRYLEAVEIRLENLPQRAQKDAEYREMVAAAWQRYAAWRELQPAGWPEPAAMTDYRWLIEELRVSLFAQRLGTARPVSMKRLDAAWTEASSPT